VDLPADCGLAQNEHPRLLLRERDLQTYKDRIAGPMKDDFGRFKGYMDEKTSAKGYDWSSLESCDGIALGVLYKLTGDRKYVDILRNSSVFKNGNTEYWEYPFTLDLVIDALSQAEIQQAADKFLAQLTRQWSYGSPSYYLHAIALIGAGSNRDAELAALIAKAIPVVEQKLGYQDFWANERGGDENSFTYLGNHNLIHSGGWICANANALGDDAWQRHQWIRHLNSYYIYHYFPWQHAAIHYDNSNGLVPGPNSGEFSASSLLAAGPARYQDGLYQWWCNLMLVQENPSVQGYYAQVRRNSVMTRLWGKILFYDPKIPELGPENFPPSRFFLTRGIASMRNDWSKDATFVHFRCGQFQLGDGRHNADNNIFSIYRKGILALDSGAQHNVETSVLKFDPAGGDPARHIMLYSSETIAHNSILVRHAIDDAFWEKYGKVNTGGQILRNRPAEWGAKRGFARDDSRSQAGKVVAWETSPEYDYVCGDASASYSADSLKSFTRQLVYLRPDIVVIYDRVETEVDGCQVSWLLHTADRPTSDGSEKPDTRIHPDGHFLLEGSTLTVTDDKMGGQMFCRTLLPEKRETRLMGGDNHEFELPGGRNIGPTAETYAKEKLAQEKESARHKGIGLSGWRIEVDDASSSRSSRFLHVLQTCDLGTARMAPCELVKSSGKATVKIEIDGRQVEIAFADSGPIAGHISVKKAGKALVDRGLADKIEDHYQRWENHPDYQKWMTDPFRQSVIMGTTPTVLAPKKQANALRGKKPR
jgi:hypothetical protein